MIPRYTKVLSSAFRRYGQRGNAQKLHQFYSRPSFSNPRPKYLWYLCQIHGMAPPLKSCSIKQPVSKGMVSWRSCPQSCGNGWKTQTHWNHGPNKLAATWTLPGLSCCQLYLWVFHSAWMQCMPKSRNAGYLAKVLPSLFDVVQWLWLVFSDSRWCEAKPIESIQNPSGPRRQQTKTFWVHLYHSTFQCVYNCALRRAHITGIRMRTRIHYMTLHHITRHNTTRHYVTLHYITLHYITLHYITLHYITYITLHCIALHCIALHYITYIHTCTHIYIILYTYLYIYIYMCVCVYMQCAHTHTMIYVWCTIRMHMLDATIARAFLLGNSAVPMLIQRVSHPSSWTAMRCGVAHLFESI